MARRERVRVLVHSKSFIAGAIIVGFWVICAIFGELLVLQDPFASNPLNQLQSPSANYWFGTDRLGRDVFSRVIVGSRDIMIIAPPRPSSARSSEPRWASSRATSAGPSTTC